MARRDDGPAFARHHGQPRLRRVPRAPGQLPVGRAKPVRGRQRPLVRGRQAVFIAVRALIRVAVVNASQWQFAQQLVQIRQFQGFEQRLTLGRVAGGKGNHKVHGAIVGQARCAGLQARH